VTTGLTNPTSDRRGWAEKALAQCYFRTPLPRLVKPIRERYILSKPTDRGWPKFRKRVGPTARILYYHRVNDDGDPFFPAISTVLFRREMEFLARNYRVVSLDHVMNHLDGEVSETVMAITFDDGYQDNFTQAFPILQRLGIPATIFLTTGSIDSREPLWFEQLSLALKKTEREELSLEMNPAMHFSIRTLEERLDCNNRVHETLRYLPDVERRRWLEIIHRSLGVKHDRERHDKMLTWEQIRLMRSHRIEFGGHTVSHPFLSRVPDDEAEREISGCKTRIENKLQCPVAYFAYPNGHEPDVSRANRDTIYRAGYRAAVTTTWGMNDSQTDRMELKRGGPWEDSAALFAFKLDWYQITND
jgi:peptidoglycan/xylan/chitin deacetylase (PgdA/CDA1 family)